MQQHTHMYAVCTSLKHGKFFYCSTFTFTDDTDPEFIILPYDPTTLIILIWVGGAVKNIMLNGDL